MSNIEMTVYLVASLGMLGLALWSLQTRDLEHHGKRATAFLFGALFALFFFLTVLQAVPILVDLSGSQRVVIGLTAGSFSAGAILMFLRAYNMRRRPA